MEKDYNISIFFDYYKNILTNKQADVIELYYNQDLSLSEIAEHLNISRQGVFDLIKRAEKILQECEEKFEISKKTNQNNQKLSDVKKLTENILKINENNFRNNEINSNCYDIIKCIDEILD